MANDATTGLTIPTGTDVVSLYAQLQAQLAQIKLNAAGLALSHDENMAQIAESSQASANQLQASLAGVAAQQQANANQYDIDLKNYGLAVAQMNAQQRQAQLQGQLNTIAEGVDVVRQRTETGMANYQQRQGALNSKLQIADMLASRKGPQDFYAYNNLLNQLSPQAPGGGSTTVDPYQWVNGLVQPISDQLPSWAANVNPDPSKINQPYTAQAGSPAQSSGAIQPAGGGVGVTSASPGSAAGSSALSYINSVLTPTAAQPSAAAPASAGPVGYDISKVNPGWNLITLGPGGDVNRSDFDPSITKVYGSDALDPTTGALKPGATEATTGKAGGAYWVYKAAGGGRFSVNQRSQLAKKGQAQPSGSYPIRNVADLHNAIRSYGRSSTPAETKAWIIKRAGELGATAALPAGWAKAAGGGKFQPGKRTFEAKAAPMGAKKTIGPVVTGDSPSGTPTGHEELATVTTTDPNAQLNVQPANPSGLDMQSGGDPGTEAQGALAAIQQGLQALTQAVAQLTGKSGAPSPAASLLQGAQNAQPPMPMDSGAGMPMPHAAGGIDLKPGAQAASDWMAANAGKGSPLPAYGGADYADSNGMTRSSTYGYMTPQQNNNPSAGYGQFAITGGNTRAHAYRPQPAQQQLPGSAIPPVDGGGQQVLPGGAVPRPDMPAAPGWSGQMQTWHPGIANVWANARQQWMRYLPHLAAGGDLTPGQATNAGGGPDSWDYYGTGTQTPTITYNQYTPAQLGSMPFIQKLWGGMQNVPFQGFGAQISNPSIGIQPGMVNGSLLNLQRYNGLNDTEQQLTQSLLGQGLGLSVDDIMRNSQAAAPVGATFATAGYRR